MQPSTVTATELQRGQKFTAAERRTARGILTAKQWRGRIELAVRQSFRSDQWSESDRAEAAAEVWRLAFDRLRLDEPDSLPVVRTSPREAALRAISWRLDDDGRIVGHVSGSGATAPLSTDRRHSVSAYYGLAGNVRDKMLRDRKRTKPLPTGGEVPSALDLVADETAEPLRVLIGGEALAPTVRQISDRAMLGGTLAEARAEAHASAARLKVPAYHVGYLAARSTSDTAKLAPDEVRAELDLTPDRWRKALERERAGIGRECDDGAADLVRFLTGVSPRAGHVGLDGRWHPATLKLRPRPKAAKQPTAVLLYCTEDNARPTYPRPGTTDAAAERHGRTMADAAAAARRHLLAEAPRPALTITEGTPTAAPLSRAQRLDALHRRGRTPRPGATVEAREAEALAEHRAANESRPDMPRGIGRAVGTAGSAERLATWQEAQPPRTVTAEPVQGGTYWLAPLAERTEHEDRIALMVWRAQRNRERRTAERLDATERSLRVSGRKPLSAAERALAPEYESAAWSAGRQPSGRQPRD